MTKKRPYKKRAKKNDPEKIKKDEFCSTPCLECGSTNVFVTKEGWDCQNCDAEGLNDVEPPEVTKKAEKVTEPAPKTESIENSMLPEKPFFRIDEVARYFDVSDRTIRMWIDHKHFETEKHHGSIRILRESILKFRLKSRVA